MPHGSLIFVCARSFFSQVILFPERKVVARMIGTPKQVSTRGEKHIVVPKESAEFVKATSVSLSIRGARSR